MFSPQKQNPLPWGSTPHPKSFILVQNDQYVEYKQVIAEIHIRMCGELNYTNPMAPKVRRPSVYKKVKFLHYNC